MQSHLVRCSKQDPRPKSAQYPCKELKSVYTPTLLCKQKIRNPARFLNVRNRPLARSNMFYTSADSFVANVSGLSRYEFALALCGSDNVLVCSEDFYLRNSREVSIIRDDLDHFRV